MISAGIFGYTIGLVFGYIVGFNVCRNNMEDNG